MAQISIKPEWHPETFNLLIKAIIVYGNPVKFIYNFGFGKWKTRFLLQPSNRIIDTSTEHLSKLGGVLSPIRKQIQIHVSMYPYIYIYISYLFLREPFGDRNLYDWRKGENTKIDNLDGQNKDVRVSKFWKK